MRQRSWLRGPDSRAVTRRPARRGPRSVVAVLKFLVMRSEFVFCKCGLRGQRGTHEVPPLLPWDTVSVACTLPPGARLPPSSARSVPASAPCRPLAWGVGAGGPRARVPLPPSAPGGPFAVSVRARWWLPCPGLAVEPLTYSWCRGPVRPHTEIAVPWGHPVLPCWAGGPKEKGGSFFCSPGALHFYFAMGSTNSVAGSECQEPGAAK